MMPQPIWFKMKIYFFDMENENEIWRYIDGYDNRYMVSNIGRIKRMDWVGINGGFYPEKILKVAKDPHYNIIPLINPQTKKRKNEKVHRLVALAFLEKPALKDFVNHKNGVKTDNRVENLEWCTKSENTKHSYDKLGRIGAMTGRKGGLNPRAKAVYCPTLGIRFGGCEEAGRELGVFATTIVRICKGKQNFTNNGLTFRYTQ